MYDFFSSKRKTITTKDDSFVLVDNEFSYRKPRDKVPQVFEFSKCNGLDLFEVTVDELQHHYSMGALNSVQYTTFCLENIRKVSGKRCQPLSCS